MSAANHSNQVLLTASDIQKLEDECARLSSELAAMDERRREIERKREEAALRLTKIRELLTALGLADRLSSAQPSDSQPDHNEQGSGGRYDLLWEEAGTVYGAEAKPSRSPWPEEIIRHLKTGPYESLTSAALRAAVETGPLANLLKVSDKGFYHTIRRLALRDEITKAHGRFFTRNGVARYKAEGEPEIEGDKSSARKSPMADEIIAFVEINGGSARAGDIVSHLLTVEPFSGPVGRNKSSAYNVLSRLVYQHQLVRLEGGVYRLPETDKAPDANAQEPHESLEVGDQTGAV